MSKELIERLRHIYADGDPITEEAADCIEQLYGNSEQLRAQLKEAQAEIERLKAENRDACIGLSDYYGQQLAASQANEVQLRDDFRTYIDEHEECTDADDWMAMTCSIEAHHVADEALSLPSDTTALEAMIAKAGDVMRERAVIECGELANCEDNSTKYRAGASFCQERIRALPGVTIGDLKGGA